MQYIALPCELMGLILEIIYSENKNDIFVFIRFHDVFNMEGSKTLDIADKCEQELYYVELLQCFALYWK